MDDFKPCPFCKSKQIVLHVSCIKPQKHWEVYCANCGCGTYGYASKSKAIMSWNRRD